MPNRPTDGPNISGYGLCACGCNCPVNDASRGVRDYPPSPTVFWCATDFCVVRIKLLSPGFCRNFGSGCEPECLHFIGVLSFDDEFHEDVACGGIQEKFGQAVAQGTG